LGKNRLGSGQYNFRGFGFQRFQPKLSAAFLLRFGWKPKPPKCQPP
jgi:hypothetical protein